VDRYLGLLAATMGRLDDAERHLRDAIRINQQMGARPWTAHSENDLARLLLLRNGVGDRDRANELQETALATARRLGMTALEARIGEQVPGRPVSELPKPSPGGVDGVFRREGEYWIVAFGGRTVRIRDTKGMRHLARLLSEPGRELHALDLARLETGPAAHITPAHADLESDALGDAGAKLDPEAKDAYRRRLNDLREEEAEAERFEDRERATRARAEIEFLTDELAGAVGLGGRDRKAASAAERARLSVTRAIRAALSRIGAENPALGKHFHATVRTGTYCSYNPDPRVPMSWQL
jgi:tetratricopeptide (TPR) repeat protein